jgi:hypothetical protein
MRGMLEDMFGNAPLDPIEAARRNMRPNLRKRFYRAATAGEGAPYPLLLDGRAVKTPAGNTLAAPALHWRKRSRRMGRAGRTHRSRRDAVDAARQHDHRRCCAQPRAGGGGDRKISRLRSLCYRASTPEGLVARQSQHWDPVLAWAREAHGARFVLSEGVMFVAQPEAAIAAARAPRSPPTRGGSAPSA